MIKKAIISIYIIVLCLTFITGCAPAPVDVNTSTPDETLSTTVNSTTVLTTTEAEETTGETTLATEAEDEVVYKPVSNKVSSDYLDNYTESTTPTGPYRPTRPGTSTDDESSKRPSHDTSNKKYKYVAFTFDDGPHYELTYKFVDKLAEYGGVGTFYVVGNRLSGKQADAVEYAYEMGNEIGVHAYTHEYYYHTCSEKRFRFELDETADLIYDITGEYPLTMRPVGGGITSSRVKSSGFAVINWNVDSNDWRYTGRSSSSSKKANVNTIVDNVLRATDANDIILFHEIYQNSYDAFCQVIDKLYDRGYRFVTVSQLLALDEDDVGKLYYSAD